MLNFCQGFFEPGTLLKGLFFWALGEDHLTLLGGQEDLFWFEEKNSPKIGATFVSALVRAGLFYFYFGGLAREGQTPARCSLAVGARLFSP